MCSEFEYDLPTQSLPKISSNNSHLTCPGDGYSDSFIHFTLGDGWIIISDPVTGDEETFSQWPQFCLKHWSLNQRFH